MKTTARRGGGARWPDLPRFPLGDLLDQRLTGAACKGRAPWFDPDPLPGEDADTTSYRLAAAASACRACPVLAPCATVADEQGVHAVGVWAGRVRGRTGLPRKARTAAPPTGPTGPEHTEPPQTPTPAPPSDRKAPA